MGHISVQISFKWDVNMKILFITNSISSFDRGDTIYSYGIMDRVSQCSEMDILTYDEELNQNFTFYHEKLRKQINNLYKAKITKIDYFRKYLAYGTTFPRYSSSMCRMTKELLEDNNYDIVIIDHLRMAFVLSVVKQFPCKIILIQHNIETNNHNELVKLKRNRTYLVKNWGLPKFEKRAIKEVSNIWCITEKDKEYFNNVSKGKNLQVIMPFFPYQKIKNDYSKTKKLVITGSMDWYPNIEGVLWFVNSVFYKLCSIDEQYKLYIVGRNPDEKLLRLKSENIIVTGMVPSVDPYLRESDLLIVPNKLGGGAKIKIIEGILKGIPAIVLRPSIVGYENIVPDQEFIVDNENEYLNAILVINGDESRKERFVKKFSENAMINADLQEIINKTI